MRAAPVHVTERPKDRYMLQRELAYADEHGFECKPKKPNGWDGSPSIPPEFNDMIGLALDNDILIMDDLHLYGNEHRKSFIDQISTTAASDDDDMSDLSEFEAYFGAELDDADWACLDAEYEAEEDGMPVIEFDRHPQAGDHVRPLSRKEQKALDREIPWRELIKADKSTRQAFVEAIHKEADAWAKWSPVRPLTRDEAASARKSKIMAKRILRSRMCHKDKTHRHVPFAGKSETGSNGIYRPRSTPTHEE